MLVTKRKPNFRIKPLALCVAVAGAVPMVAQAEILELIAQGSYKLGADPVQALQDGPKTTGSVDVLRFTSSGANQAGLHSYGSDPDLFGSSGNFGTRSSGSGVYDVTGLFRIREKITNTTGVARQVSFNFNITPGLLSNDLFSLFGPGEFVQSSVDFNVNVIHGATTSNPFTSHASLRSDETGLGLFSASGETSFYAPTPSGSSSIYYTVNSFSKTLDNIGVLAAGDSLEIDYEIKSAASGNATNSAGGIMIPEQIIDVPGHWEWSDIAFDNNVEGANPNEAQNGECYGGYGGPALASAAVVDGVIVDPGKPPTDSACWHFVQPTQVTIPKHTILDSSPNGSHSSSGDPFTLGFGPNPGNPGYYSGLLPLRGGAFLGNPVSDVPEPGVLGLFGFGLAGVLLRRRRS